MEVASTKFLQSFITSSAQSNSTANRPHPHTASNSIPLEPRLTHQIDPNELSTIQAAVTRFEARSSTDPSSTPHKLDAANIRCATDSEMKTDECTRKVCTSTFDLPADSNSLTLYYAPHQVQKQHFDSPQTDVERSLRAQIEAADQELARLLKSKHRVDHHIQVLHDYNEIKDVVQSLMGKCAELEGRTTKDMYQRFGLELDD